MKVLIAGGTGTVGTCVMRALLESGHHTRILTRSPERAGPLPDGAAAVRGDLESPASLEAAFDGAEAVFLATPLHPDEAQLGLNAVRAAMHARARYVVYLSVHHAGRLAHIPHFASKLPVEERLHTSGLPFTILRPNNFFQNDLRLREPIAGHGVYPQPLSEKGISRVDVRDIADAAVAVLTRPGHEGKTYALVGPQALTGEEVAAAFARHLRRGVRYIGADLDGWEQNARRMLPEWMVRDLRLMYAHFLEHGLAATPEEVAALTELLGRPPRKFEDFAAECAAAWRSPGAGDQAARP
jgi:uncharacterized protein YbjT (DUF2867 family)